MTGEIENYGEADSISIVAVFRARNSEGAALTDASVFIGTVRRNSDVLFEVIFRSTDTWGSRAVDRLDYELTYVEDGEEKLGGRGTVSE